MNKTEVGKGLNQPQRGGKERKERLWKYKEGWLRGLWGKGVL